MSQAEFADLFKLDMQPSETDMQFLENQINQFNVTQTKMDDFQRLAFVLRDADDTIIAGIAGWTWGGCGEIRSLWVAEALRGQGFGQRLLRLAEQEAARRGCGVIVLGTHSFQAPGFYQKQGYEVIGIVQGYPRGHQNYYFQKRLLT